MASELEDILAAVKVAVEGLSLTLGGASIPVLLGKSPRFRTGLEPPVALTVSKAPRAEQVTRWSFTANRTDYYVSVTLVSPWRGPDRDLGEYESLRQQVLDAFDRPPLPGAPDVFDLKAEPRDYLPPAGQEQQWDFSSVEVTASVVRSR